MDLTAMEEDFKKSKISSMEDPMEDRWALGMDPSRAFSEWDTTTARFADSATVPFSLLQLPQITLNAQNLLRGENFALFAVLWMETSMLSTLVVLSQLAIAGAMPSAAFFYTASVVPVGLVLNISNYKNMLEPGLWRLWAEAVTIGGITVLSQVMWSTFEPYTPHSTLPGIVFGVLAVSMIILARLGKLPPKAKDITGSVSAWTPTLLFIWAAVAQWWQNNLYPANVRGLSLFTILLAMIGHSLLLPRALFTRDLMCFVGSSSGALLQGWAIVVSMYLALVISTATFWSLSTALFIWLSTMLWKDSKAYEMNSLFDPLVEVITGKRFS